VTEAQADYLTTTSNIDYNVGRLLGFLEKKNLDENTIILFMNDNCVTLGLDVYNAGMRGSKCTIWEGGSPAMSFWRWKNKWQPKSLSNLTSHLDVLPTLAKLANVKIPDRVESKLEGYDLSNLLFDKEATNLPEDRRLFHHVARWGSGTAKDHKYTMCGVRTGNFLQDPATSR